MPSTKLALVFLAPLASGQEGPPMALRLGAVHEGVIDADAAVVRSPGLAGEWRERYWDREVQPAVGQGFTLRVAEAGLYRIELRSFHFDPYLVLRDPSGEVIAEDDDGGVEEHARLVVELEAGEDYALDAVALYGHRGSYELVLVRGPPRALEGSERAEADLASSRRRLEVAIALEGRDSARHAWASNELGRWLGSYGEHEEALECFEGALAIRERTLDAGHPRVADTLANLGLQLARLERPEEARAALERALALSESALGPRHTETARRLDFLADFLKDQGELGRARSLYERELAIVEELRPDAERTAGKQNLLGVLLDDLGDRDADGDLYARAIATYERALGPDPPAAAKAVSNLAGVLRRRGELEAAVPLYERALMLTERGHGPDHRETVFRLQRLGDVLLELRRLEEALPVCERALATAERVHGAQHPSTAVFGARPRAGDVRAGSRRGGRGADPAPRAPRRGDPRTRPPRHGPGPLRAGLGVPLPGPGAARRRGLRAGPRRLRAQPRPRPPAGGLDHDGAGIRAHLARRALRGDRVLRLGAPHPRAAALRGGERQPGRGPDGYGKALVSTGQLALAREHLDRSLEIHTETCGLEDLALARLLVELGHCVHEQGDDARGLALQERALAIFAADDPLGSETIRARAAIAHTLAHSGEREGARAVVESLLADAPGLPVLERAWLLGRSAETLEGCGEVRRARELYEAALDLHAEAFGPDDPRTAIDRVRLAGDALPSTWGAFVLSGEWR